MILIILLILFSITGLAFVMYGFEEFEGGPLLTGTALLLIALLIGIYGIFNGFINYPPSEGVHQGVVTAVDREGYLFNHYKIYIKSNGINRNNTDNISDETEYCLYLDESELANQIKEYIGKTVKVYYSHPGGGIGIKSCGTYHINKVELIEE